MTIEEKARAYDEALKRVKIEFSADITQGTKNVLMTLFPELKESEDERIRKRLIDLIYKVYAFTNYITCVEYENIIAWLEKQGDTTSDIRYDGVNAGASLSVVNGNSFDYEKATITQKDFASVGETATIELSSPIDCGDRIYHVSHKPIEKQGEQKPTVVDFNAKDWYVSKVDGKIHDMTYNPTNKIEPKFKVGDYIVNDYCTGRVVEITNDAYLLDAGQGISFSCEDKVHLWTIADAKEGDILAGKIDGDNYILIFKTIKDGWIETYGHYYNAVNRFCAPSQLFCRSYQGTFTPATKEQRDILIKAMADTGYKWDAEKKELKIIDWSKHIKYEPNSHSIIEQKQEWNEEDETMRKNIEGALDCYEGMAEGMVAEDWEEEKQWLKSIKDRVQPQSKIEWSEKDKEMAEDLIKGFQSPGKSCYLVHTSKEIVDWLKSLKDRMKGKEEKK